MEKGQVNCTFGFRIHQWLALLLYNIIYSCKNSDGDQSYNSIN